MNNHDIYKWLDKKKGQVTIQELINHFPDASPEEIAIGFNDWVNDQLGEESYESRSTYSR